MQTLIVTENAALLGVLARAVEPVCTKSRSSVFSDQVSEADCVAMLALLKKGWSCSAIAVEQGVPVPIVKARLMQLYRQTGRHKQPNRR